MKLVDISQLLVQPTINNPIRSKDGINVLRTMGYTNLKSWLDYCCSQNNNYQSKLARVDEWVEEQYILCPASSGTGPSCSTYNESNKSPFTTQHKRYSGKQIKRFHNQQNGYSSIIQPKQFNGSNREPQIGHSCISRNTTRHQHTNDAPHLSKVYQSQIQNYSGLLMSNKGGNSLDLHRQTNQHLGSPNTTQSHRTQQRQSQLQCYKDRDIQPYRTQSTGHQIATRQHYEVQQLQTSANGNQTPELNLWTVGMGSKNVQRAQKRLYSTVFSEWSNKKGYATNLENNSHLESEQRKKMTQKVLGSDPYNQTNLKDDEKILQCLQEMKNEHTVICLSQADFRDLSHEIQRSSQISTGMLLADMPTNTLLFSTVVGITPKQTKQVRDHILSISKSNNQAQQTSFPDNAINSLAEQSKAIAIAICCQSESSANPIAANYNNQTSNREVWGNIFVIPLFNNYKSSAIEESQRKVLTQLLTEKSNVVCFNSKEFIRICLEHNQELPPPHLIKLHDPKIEAWKMQPHLLRVEIASQNYNLYNLAKHYNLQLEELLSKEDQQLFLPQILENSLMQLRADLISSAFLQNILSQKIAGEGSKSSQTSNITVHEQQISAILAGMEFVGVPIDVNRLRDLDSWTDQELRVLAQSAKSMLGHAINLNSPQQVSKALYSDLHLKRPTSDSSGKLGTDRSMLQQLMSQHKFPGVVMQHRSVQKFRSLWVTAHWSNYIRNAQPNIKLSNQQMRSIASVHCDWRQTNTVTGRVTSSAPNVQTLPKNLSIDSLQLQEWDADIQWPFGNQEADTTGNRNSRQVQPRRLLRSRDPCILVSADYKNIELRLIAHFSQDQSLIDLLRDPTIDCFTSIANHWLKPQLSYLQSTQQYKQTDVQDSNIQYSIASTLSHQTQNGSSNTGQTGDLASLSDDKLRNIAKRLVYSIVYGVSQDGISRQLQKEGLQLDNEQYLIDNFFTTFPGLKAYISQNWKESGVTYSISGRRLQIQDLQSPSYVTVQAGVRQAVNASIQSSAADIIKIAMCNWSKKQYDLGFHRPKKQSVDLNLQESGQYTTKRAWNPMGPVQLVAQVHDELLFTLDPTMCDVKQQIELIREAMENAVQLSVPLLVSVYTGPSWGELEAFDCKNDN